MQIIDTITAQLNSLSRETKALPAQLDALEACREAGVPVPSAGVWANMDDLDIYLTASFAPTGKPMDTRTFEKRVRLKNLILKAGMVASQPGQLKSATQDGAVREAIRLMKVHGIKPREDGTMFLISEIDAMAKEKNLSAIDSITIKRAFEVAGLLDTTDTIVKASAPAKPSTAAADLIFAELEIPPQRLHVNALSAFMTQRGVETKRRMEIKEVLGSAGYLIF
jgi:hypothetical protein